MGWVAESAVVKHFGSLQHGWSRAKDKNGGISAVLRLENYCWLYRDPSLRLGDVVDPEKINLNSPNLVTLQNSVGCSTMDVCWNPLH